MPCMFKISFLRSNFIPPTEPVLRFETAINSDGGECGIGVPDENGGLDLLPPHFHLVESQQDAWTRYYAVGGALPSDLLLG